VINTQETIQAMAAMGKKKANATDELLDLIFQTHEWNNMKGTLGRKGLIR